MTSGQSRSEVVAALRTSSAVRWVALTALAWVMLRPSLLITISGDDFINPFWVSEEYGTSPFAGLVDINRVVLENGHFNVVGQSVGAVVFRIWAHLVSWGVRYSFVYALTKLLVFVFVAAMSARVLRTLAALGGRTITVWWSRLLVALTLFPTLQIHVAWSHDPVASFPLSGYLSLAIGLWAFDAACRALADGSPRRVVLAAAALCLSILYYEINVAMLAALVPVVIVHVRRSSSRDVLVRTAAIVAPAVAMTLVLQRIAAAAAERAYTGTDVAVGDGALTTTVRALLGSLPASAWGAARDWLDEPFAISGAAIGTTVVVVAAVVAAVVIASRREVRDGDGPARRIDHGTIALAALGPLLMWLAATVVQAATLKVQAETRAVGYVYNYYAYGSVGLALAALLLAPLLPRHDLWRRARPLLVAAAAVSIAAQSVVNEQVHRRFDAVLASSNDVLAVYTDERPLEERCAVLARWLTDVGYLPDYYRTDFVDGVNATYLHFEGEPFCASATP